MPDTPTSVRPSRPLLLAFLVVGAGAVLGLAGIDLVLPAIPHLPTALGGDHAAAQLVLAAFVAGMSAGLLIFGALAARFSRRALLCAALTGFAAASLLGALAGDIALLIATRFLQGICASAPAVFAPGIIRASMDEHAATRAIGALGSLEALAPAFAPIAGAWLVDRGGWQAPLVVIALLAAPLALLAGLKGVIPEPSRRKTGSYATLLRSARFRGLALGHAFTLGGLLVFVLGAPAVFVHSLGGTIGDFIRMQVIGVAAFIAAANGTAALVRWRGARQVILLGTLLCIVSAACLLAYALAGGRDPLVVALLFLPMNLGFGLRGPPGFLAAIGAGDGDDDRASSLVVLAITAVSAAGTAALAPFIDQGLPALASAAFVLQAAAVTLLATASHGAAAR
jgi:MFS transporter, DHA1 family, multidrug resistance protein